MYYSYPDDCADNEIHGNADNDEHDQNDDDGDIERMAEAVTSGTSPDDPLDPPGKDAPCLPHIVMDDDERNFR